MNQMFNFLPEVFIKISRFFFSPSFSFFPSSLASLYLSLNISSLLRRHFLGTNYGLRAEPNTVKLGRGKTPPCFQELGMEEGDGRDNCGMAVLEESQGV